MTSASHHFGPSITEVGGMASVIRTFVTHSIGGSDVRAHPTWFASSARRSALASARALATLTRIPRQDTVHVHLSEGGSFVREGALVMAAGRRSLRTVVHLHGADFAATASAHPRVVGAVLRSATHVSCLSLEALRIAETLAPARPSRLIPNPVELDAHAPPADETEPIVVFAGEVGRRKGIDVLAAAWPMVLERSPQAALVVIGPAGDCPMPPLPRVTVLPAADGDAVRELIRSARVIALPSRAEAMPMTLLEAQASRRPYVATPVGGIATLTASGGGTLVPVEDHHALAEALGTYLNDVERARSAGQCGQDACRHTRSPDVISRAYDEFLTIHAP